MSTRLLFVCLGNICRSATAEGIMQAFVKQRGLENEIECDSAGVISYHVGESADPRMRQHASKRDYSLDSISRQFDPSTDFEKFDLILTMDHDNYSDVMSMDPTGQYHGKVKRMASYCRNHQATVVPDPYYRGPEGFERVLDILEDACEGLLDELKK